MATRVAVATRKAVIAAYYTLLHASDDVTTNDIPIKSILKDLRVAIPMVLSTGAKGLGGKPDILNTTQQPMQLYEIKKETLLSSAIRVRDNYLMVLRSTGLNVEAGRMNEPGVNGILPSVAGYIQFWSPQPGVILWRLLKNREEAMEKGYESEEENRSVAPNVSRNTVYAASAIAVFAAVTVLAARTVLRFTMPVTNALP